MSKLKIASIALAAVLTAGLVGEVAAQTFVPQGSLVGNVTWGGGANPSPIILQGAVFVKGGTLTILPGTTVRGQPRTGPVVPGSSAGTPGALIITQTGRIVADSSASNSIVMTTAAVDNNGDGRADDLNGNGFKDAYPGFNPADCPGACALPGLGLFYDSTPKTAPLAPLDSAGFANVALWGGLVILGNAPTNNALKAGVAVGYGKTLIEGLTVPGFPPADATYGGVLPHDNSGVLRYVSVRHAGDEIGASNELNGVSLGGVGDGTVIEFVEVYANFDDGIEWFGGTVNGKNLVVTMVGDDMFDVDEGYTGVNQFLLGIQPHMNQNNGTNYGSKGGEKGCEFDGDNYRPDAAAFFDNVNVRVDVTLTDVDPTPWPLSQSSWWNMTLIGHVPSGGQDFVPVAASPQPKKGCQFRNGFAGAVYNSVIVNTGAETGIEVDTDLGEGAPGFDALNNANNGLLLLVSSTTDGGAAPGATENTVIANGNTLATKLGGTANVINNASFLGLVYEDVTFDPRAIATGGKLANSGGLLKATKIDPRLVPGLVGTAGGVPPQGPDLDPSGAAFRGAFPGGVPNWTAGWTVFSQAKLMAD